jgi:hypothetical protein
VPADTELKAIAAIVVSTMLWSSALEAQSTAAGDEPVPQYRFDPTWPVLPLPNKWQFQGITGLTVDDQDRIWVLQRPGDFDIDPIFQIPNRTTNYAALDPPTASCCLKPVAILAFDMEGNLLEAWDQPGGASGHLILADAEGYVWVGSDTIRKTMSRADVGNPEPGAVSPDTPLIVGRVEGGDFDEAARELYVTDSYLRGRVLVYDMDTFEFKRGWGAYGKPLVEIGIEAPVPYTPGNHDAPDFRGHVTIAVAQDGEVYVADRVSDRIQVFTRDGVFVREFTVAPETLGRGSTGGIAFSPLPEQRYLYVSDIMNNVIWIVNRRDGRTLGHFSYFGRNGGGLHWAHMVATDRAGNVYTGEVDTGKRVQRFRYEP